MKQWLPAFVACFLAGAACAQAVPPAPRPTPVPAATSEHVKIDIARHRALAQAHEAAARCLESRQPEEACAKALQAACKGLAIGKYCGMRHEH